MSVYPRNQRIFNKTNRCIYHGEQATGAYCFCYISRYSRKVSCEYSRLAARTGSNPCRGLERALIYLRKILVPSD
jgi:hypothetical protein